LRHFCVTFASLLRHFCVTFASKRRRCRRNQTECRRTCS
jgi:hypothetical protein